MSETRTTLPNGFKWAPMTPELDVSDLASSLGFWCDLIGFSVAYARVEERFAYLDLDGAQVMLEQPTHLSRNWLTAALEKPFGRGVNFQFTVPDCDTVYDRVKKAGLPLFMEIEEKWYRAGDMETGVRQFLVQDPDGYLLRPSGSLGRRRYSGNEGQ